MSKQVTIGGERLSSGNKMKAEMQSFSRSTHNLSHVLRTTMSPGTLVPALNLIGLPGTSYKIKMALDIMTMPTLGPLFGSFKVDVHLFQAPVRLYQGKLAMNTTKIGMDMAQVKLPIMQLVGKNLTQDDNLDTVHINPSSIFSYLGIRGLGYNDNPAVTYVHRDVNAIGLLTYWDIYKNYFANKQEEIGVVIHTEPLIIGDVTLPTFQLIGYNGKILNIVNSDAADWTRINLASPTTKLTIVIGNITDEQMEYFTADRFTLQIFSTQGEESITPITEIFTNIDIDWSEGETTMTIICTQVAPQWYGSVEIKRCYFEKGFRAGDIKAPQLRTFPLEDLDEMRMNILADVKSATAFSVNAQPLEPYRRALEHREDEEGNLVWAAATENQEGLGIKTYLSDKYNNWLSTEWIDGDNGVNEVTAIDTSGGSITIDQINLAEKIWKMLNRVAMSGGTVEDWQDSTYDHVGFRRATSPIYLGGIIQEMVFQEVVSNSSTPEANQPLGTLAGRGVLGRNKKGGYIDVRIDEHSYIMAIASLTPRIDYSQGNEWFINLKTMDDYHKPPLDQIGFQDLITEGMAWWDNAVNPTGNVNNFKSAGKQPAWINYMTETNKVKGNFADPTQQMFMVLTRRYEPDWTLPQAPTIKDLTTYIDPSKFNHIFADTRLDAQNFWVQIGFDIEARIKMSAKIMPNL